MLTLDMRKMDAAKEWVCAGLDAGTLTCIEKKVLCPLLCVAVQGKLVDDRREHVMDQGVLNVACCGEVVVVLVEQRVAVGPELLFH